MAKDKAFLFYPHDFLKGSLLLSIEERGKYITLLCHMHQRGRMKEDEVRMLVGEVSEGLQTKFKIDEDGYWYNLRLEIETNRRDRFVESRRNNAKQYRPVKREVSNVAVLPLLDETDMQEVFKQWTEYRKLIHKPLKAQSMEGAFNRLKELSSNDPARAKQIVKYSIDNGYQGLFPIKQNEYKQHKTITEQWLS